MDLALRKSCKPAVERILEFGRELYSMNQRLKSEHLSSEHNEKMLEVSVVCDLLPFESHLYGLVSGRI